MRCNSITKPIVFVALLLFTGVTTAEKVNTNPTIKWDTYNLPPGMCINIETEIPCFVNHMVQTLQDRLSNDYQHDKHSSSLKRLLLELKVAQDLIIAPALSYTDDRAKFIQYSYTVPFPRLPYVIAIKASKKNKFMKYLNPEGLIDLDKLMASSLETLLFEGRSYGKYLNPIINKHKKSKQSLVNYTNIKGMKFLYLDRIDYLIVYPPHAIFGKDNVAKNDFNILTYPILDSPSYVASRLGSNKSTLGKELIRKINFLLYDKDIIKSTTDNYRSWLPINLQPYYDKVSKQYQIDRLKIDKIEGDTYK